LTTQLPFLRTSQNSVAGIPPQRSIPPFAPQTFKNWFQRRRPNPADRAATALPFSSGPTPSTNYFLPATAKAAVEVLEAAGFQS